MEQAKRVIILGAGPAGLMAGYELSHSGIPACVCEQDNVVGGLARTIEYNGFRFDIGGHRFFTKIEEIQGIWRQILDGQFVERRRLSRIYYRGKFFHYPLKPLNAFFGLGPVESVLILMSYLRSQVCPSRREENFEEWVSNRFGCHLYRIFFKAYTEKVWGVPCTSIRADWAAQRIRDLSLGKAIANMFAGRRKEKQIVTLLDRFYYPTHGPGMMWEAVTQQLRAAGQEVRLRSEAVRLNHDNCRVVGVIVRSPDGKTEEIEGSHFISSIPLRGLIRRLDPPPPDSVREAAERLRYRNFILVGMVVNRADLFPDNWIYIHAPEVCVGRIQNYKNWHPEMCAQPEKTNLGLEYFCRSGDRLWRSSDAELIDLAKGELESLGLAWRTECEDGLVVRVPKAYPVYDGDYARELETIKRYIGGFANLQMVGRNGQHRYNNQDHSMLTGLLAARNILGAHHDLWSVNTERQYLG